MIKKLVRYGNSQAIVLDRAILELLGIEEGGQVKLSVEGSTLIVKPVELSAPAQAEAIPAVKEPQAIAELRKLNEQDDKHFVEDAQLIRRILMASHADADQNLVTTFSEASTSEKRIAVLTDFVLNNSCEFKERMRNYLREMVSRTTRLFSNSSPAQGLEVQAWIAQERDRIEEKREAQRVKQEKAYADIKKITVADLKDLATLEGLLTPEILEQILTNYIAKLNQEIMLGMF